MSFFDSLKVAPGELCGPDAMRLVGERTGLCLVSRPFDDKGQLFATDPSMSDSDTGRNSLSYSLSCLKLFLWIFR